MKEKKKKKEQINRLTRESDEGVCCGYRFDGHNFYFEAVGVLSKAVVHEFEVEAPLPVELIQLLALTGHCTEYLLVC